MEDVLTHQEGQGELTNFQAASCTLDARFVVHYFIVYCDTNLNV